MIGMDSSHRESDSVIGDLQQALRKVDLPYVDGLYDWQTDLAIRKNKDRERIGTRSIKGISLRCFTDRGWIYSSSNKTDASTIRKLAQDLKRSRPAKSSGGMLAEVDPIKLDERYPVKVDAQQVAVEEKLQRIRSIFNLARGMDSRIIDVRVNYSEVIVDRALVTSRGTQARQSIPRTRISLEVIVRENGVTDHDYASLGGTVGFEVADDLTEQRVKETVEGAVEQLKAVTPPTGPQEVILDPGTVGTVCHESFGHGLEADQAIRGRSYLKEMLGKKVASDLVTIYEDSSLKGGHGSYYFDDDGALSRRNTLVEKGVLVSFLHDVETAAAMKATLTASSRTQNAAHRRFIRMSNTYSKPGDWTVDQMIEDTKNGVMMLHWLFGMEDPLGGGMQVTSKRGYLIENGKKTKPLKSITLTGRVLNVLGSVDAISKEDFIVEPGNCGKGAEDMVPVGDGGTWWRTTAVIA
jgi:TldD protein